MTFHAAHNWGDQPIVTLTNVATLAEVEWSDGPNTKTFTPSIYNTLTVQVRMRYKDPYGGSARYRILIDRYTDSGWENVHTDELTFITDSRDRKWHTELRDYGLFAFSLTGGVLKFRITVSVEEGGRLPTGGEGSLGHWSAPQSREFTARFRQMAMDTRRQFLDSLEVDIREGLNHAKKRFLTEPAKAEE